MLSFNFEPLKTAHKDMLKDFVNHAKSISCELSVGNLLTWNKAEETEYCLDGDILYLRSRTNGILSYYFPLFKSFKSFKYLPNEPNEQEIISAINNLYTFHVYNCKDSDKIFSLSYLIQEQAEFFKKFFSGKFNLSLDRNRSEYIYEAEKFRTYSGKKLHGKKNHLNKFYALYGDTFKYESIDEANIGECMEMSCEWSKINSYYLNSSMIAELEVVSEQLNNFRELGLIGGCMRIGGKIKGFTIGEAAFDGSDTVVIHVEKAMYDVEGIYPALASHFLIANPQFKYVNREDDVGDEGLRKSKLSYYPLYLLDKYIASAVE